MAAVTRLWPYGGPGHPYGDFSGKAEQIIVEAERRGGDDLPPLRRKKKLKHPYEDRDRIQAAIDATLEAAAARALGEAPAVAEVATAAVERVRKAVEDAPIEPVAIQSAGLPMDAAVELTILARLEAAIRDINQQREDEAIICLLLAA